MLRIPEKTARIRSNITIEKDVGFTIKILCDPVRLRRVFIVF